MRILFLTLIAVWMALPASTFELTLINEWENPPQSSYVDPIFSADGSIVYLMRSDWGIEKYDPYTGENLGSVSLENLQMEAKFSNMEMSHDKSTMMIRDKVSNLYFFDALNEQPLGRFISSANGQILSYAISGDGSFALITNRLGELMKVDTETGIVLMRDSIGDEMNGIGVSPDGSIGVRANSRKYISGIEELYDNNIIIFNAETLLDIDTIKLLFQPSNENSFSARSFEFNLDKTFFTMLLGSRLSVINFHQQQETWYKFYPLGYFGSSFINNTTLLVSDRDFYNIRSASSGDTLYRDSIFLPSAGLHQTQNILVTTYPCRTYSYSTSGVLEEGNSGLSVFHLESNLSLRSSFTNYAETIEILDINGKSLSVFDNVTLPLGETISLPFSASRGVYLCKVTSGGNSYVKKFYVGD